MRQMPAAVLVGIGATRARPAAQRQRARFARQRRMSRDVIHGGPRARNPAGHIFERKLSRIRKTRKRHVKGRLVKGSRAAKLHMARLRRMRKR